MERPVKGGGEGIAMSSFLLTFYLSAVINFNNTNPTGNFPRRPIDPCNLAHAYPLIRNGTSSDVDEVEQVERVRRLPAHLFSKSTPNPRIGRMVSSISL
jgi:hypothetical protein